MKQPLIIPINHQYAKVEKDYKFTVHYSKNKQLRICREVVPAGYSDYNGMSGGSFLLGLIGFGRFGYQNAATLVHDYLYVHEGRVGIHKLARKVVDYKLYNDLLMLGYSRNKCKLIYRIVRIFGYYYWREI